LAEDIGASVGKTNNGTKECFNIPKDQLAIIRLLNSIKKADGGRQENPLPTTPMPSYGISTSGLSQAILDFQRKYPGLSQDGHVDPGNATLRKMNEIASRTPAPTTAPIRSCTLSPSSKFATYPPPLLETICRSYKAHVAKSVFYKTLPGAFGFGAETEPANFDEVLDKSGVSAMKTVYDRMSAISGLWPFVDLIYHAWSAKNDGFDFATSSNDSKRDLTGFLDKSSNFARDSKVGQMVHQDSDSIGSKILAPDHQCWREVINGSPGLHICLSNTSPYENSVHVDPTQIVKSKDADGYCDYDLTTDLKHLWHEKEILKKTFGF